MLGTDMRKLRARLRAAQRELTELTREDIYPMPLVTQLLWEVLPQLFEHLEHELALQAQQAREAEAASNMAARS